MLELGDMFANTGGWGLERAFSKWTNRLPLRQCLPQPFEQLGSTFFDVPSGNIAFLAWFLPTGWWSPEQLCEIMRPHTFLHSYKDICIIYIYTH